MADVSGRAILHGLSSLCERGRHEACPAAWGTRVCDCECHEHIANAADRQRMRDRAQEIFRS